MPDKTVVGVILGSPRKEGWTRKLAAALKGLAPEGLELKVLEIAGLPLFNPDEDDASAHAWIAFREAVRGVDALLFVTPEYNRSVPAVLKNALEVGSRPYNRIAWNGKPAAIASFSPGMLGGFGANHHLRQILVFLNMPVLQQPEIYLSQVDKLFDAEGALLEGPVRDLLARFMAEFKGFIQRHR